MHPRNASFLRSIQLTQWTRLKPPKANSCFYHDQLYRGVDDGKTLRLHSAHVPQCLLFSPHSSPPNILHSYLSMGSVWISWWHQVLRTPRAPTLYPYTAQVRLRCSSPNRGTLIMHSVMNIPRLILALGVDTTPILRSIQVKVTLKGYSFKRHTTAVWNRRVCNLYGIHSRFHTWWIISSRLGHSPDQARKALLLLCWNHIYIPKCLCTFPVISIAEWLNIRECHESSKSTMDT